MRKGSNYEREICKKLSLWWTDGVRDDIYWRTASSGGRATARKKLGKSTVGQYGDVQATDPIGKPLTDLCIIEIKRGYSRETFANLIERHQNPKVKECLYEKFIKQAIKEKRQAKTPYWLLIVKRNAREPIVVLPWGLYHQYEHYITPMANITFYYRDEEDFEDIIILLLDSFLKFFTPGMMKRLWLRKKKKKIRR